MADTNDSTAKFGGSQSGKPCPRFANDGPISWERRPNSDQTVGPVLRPRRWIASPGAMDDDEVLSSLLGLVFVVFVVDGQSVNKVDDVAISSDAGADLQTPSKQGALSTISSVDISTLAPLVANNSDDMLLHLLLLD